MKKVITFFVAVLLISISTVQAARYYVKPTGNDSEAGTTWANAFQTVEKALSTAIAGDEIWIAAGTYQPVLNSYYTMKNDVAVYGGFNGTESMLEQRDWNTNQTILKGNGSSVIRNVFTETTALNRSAIIDGFTITDGKGAPFVANNNIICGGGILCIWASPTIRNCIIENCTAQDAGGIGCAYSAPKIESTIIRNNNISSYNGGGLGCGYGSFPELVDVIITNNHAVQAGGGVFVTGANLSLTNCVISGNYSAYKGGGVYNGGTTTFTNCVITGNAASTYGGGLENENGHSILRNVTVAGNYAGSAGGGIRDRNSQSGYYVEVEIYNSIIWGNRTGSGINNIYYDPSRERGFLSIGNSLLEGSGGSGAQWNANHGVDLGNNIDADPLFINYQYTSNTTPTSAGDFHLLCGSPAINTGDNSYNETLTDLDNNPRIIRDIIDMGAYEFSKLRLYVNQNSQNGSNNGLSWATAYSRLEDALHYAGSSADCKGEIWVAQGIYQPGMDSSYVMHNNWELYGGFLGTEQNLTSRNWGNNSTILKGNNSSVIRNIYTEDTPLDRTAILDGFIITNGVALTDEVYAGGGIYNENASPVIQNCIIENCIAQSGGGVFNWFSSPQMNHVIIRNNTAMEDGGGMENAESSVELIHVTLADNSVEDGYGGGMYNVGSELSSTDVKITNNLAGIGGGMYNEYSIGDLENIEFTANRATMGGGLYNTETSTSNLINARITGNVADYGGGIYNADRSSVYLINSTVSGNNAGTAGGIYNASSRSTVPAKSYVKNSIVWGNHAVSATGVNMYNRYNSSSSIIDVTYSLIEGCSGSGFWANTSNKITNSGNNIDGNPMFVNYQYAPDVSTPVTTGNFRLLLNSPAINAGNNTYNSTATDLDGNNRKVQETIDMGVYEFQFAKSLIVAELQEGGSTEESTVNEIADRITVKAYPNPVQAGNNVTIEIPLIDESLDMELEIYTILGVKVGEYRVTDTHTAITLPDAKGHYILKIFTRNGFMDVKKIVVM